MRIYIIRHADPEYRGDTLTPHGRLEAEALADRFFHAPQGKLDYIYSSPKGRALVTAKYTEEKLNIKSEIEDWTKELSHWPHLNLSGSGTNSINYSQSLPGEGGLALWDIPAEYIRTLPEPISEKSQWDLVPQFANIKEEYLALCASSDDFIARHGYVREGGRYRIVNSNRHQIAVFCHGGFGLTWLSHLLQIPLSIVYASFWLAPSSITTILFDERSNDYATPRCIGLGDLGHLTKHGLSTANSRYERPNCFGNWDRPSGIKANFF